MLELSPPPPPARSHVANLAPKCIAATGNADLFNALKYIASNLLSSSASSRTHGKCVPVHNFHALQNYLGTLKDEI